ncbi:MAG: acyl-(acyl-carrier-protein)--UDP-N-acetylglucosamine O-acyltransferase [Planctomycetota bacterium]|nr:acyl-(acyl-carrier-protein)--UDP-N-acetylglucosamine O-acyltransferase [Planctomycetota bacterium]
MSLAVSEAIHPTAVIGPDVEIADDVQIGPFAILEGSVRIGPGCVIEGHACLSGPLVMGRDNFVGHGAVLGKSPQSKSYCGDPTTLIIGDGNTFREYVTVHRGTIEGGGRTRVGDKNLLMIGSHLGHDCHIGDGCTLVNGALAAGHVQLANGCILSGHAAVQQRVRIGRLAMLGGLGSTTKDVPPFVLQQGYNCVTGLNLVGLRRAGFSPATITALRECFRILFKEGRCQSAALDRIDGDLGQVPEVAEFVSFIRESRLGINPARESSRQRRAF